MPQCSKQMLHYQCSTSVMASVTGDWTVTWLGLSICSFSTKTKSTLLCIMEIKVFVQIKTSLSCTNSCPLQYICSASNLSVSQAWLLNCVTNTRSTLLKYSPLGQQKMTPQMFVNSLSLYEHSGVLWWQFTALGTPHTQLLSEVSGTC